MADELTDDQKSAIFLADDWAATNPPPTLRLYIANGSRVRGNTQIFCARRTCTAKELEDQFHSSGCTSPLQMLDVWAGDGRLEDGSQVYALTAQELLDMQTKRDFWRRGWCLDGERTGAPMINFSVHNNLKVYQGLSRGLDHLDGEILQTLVSNDLHGPLTHMTFMCSLFLTPDAQYVSCPDSFSYDPVATALQAEWTVVFERCVVQGEETGGTQGRVEMQIQQFVQAVIDSGGLESVQENTVMLLCDRWQSLHSRSELKHCLDRDKTVFMSWLQTFSRSASKLVSST